MKSPKKPSKESSLPAQDEARRANVLMEQMLSKFDAFGEAQSHIIERLDRMEPDLHAVKEDVAVLKSAARSHTHAIQANTEAIHSLQADVAALKSDVSEIKGDVKGYNQRLEAVEAKLA